MHNLLRMDLYRMKKATGFIVTLILAFVFAAAQTPLGLLLSNLARMLDSSVSASLLPASVPLASFLSAPLPFLNAMLALLSAAFFFYADVEFGYIKNIAGQMPKKGYTLLSKYFAIALHNLLFMIVGVLGGLLGSVFIQKITLGDDLARGFLDFGLKFLLLQALCTVLLFVCSVLRSKSLGTVLAVLLGSGMMFLLYSGLSSSLNNLLRLKDFALEDYMPDQLLGADHPVPLTALVSAAVTICLFLPLSIRVFDRRDVK